MNVTPHPESCIEMRIDRLDVLSLLSAACAGYDLGDWRVTQLARHVVEWLGK